jgi:chloramphenicol 3-O phosphotransferase
MDRFLDALAHKNHRRNNMKIGKVILLNGPSCSGKTSISRSMQTTLREPCFYISIDNMLGCIIQNDYFIDDPFLYLGKIPLQDRSIHQQSDRSFHTLMDILFPQFIKGFHATIAAYAGTGVTVIVDHLFHEKDWLLDCINVLQSNTVYCVGVHCAQETLKAREKSRSGQFPGMVEYQTSRVHQYCEYDFVIDTTEKTAQESAEIIIAYLNTGATPRAFDNMFVKFKSELAY